MGLLRTAHAWAGLALSLILVVLGLSGAALVFKDDFVRATVPEARAAVVLDAAAMGAAAAAAERSLGSQGLRSLVLAGDGLGVHKAALADDASALVAGDGTVIAVNARNERFEDWLFDLHHHLLAGETGETAAGVAALAALVLLVTGVAISLPTLRGFAARLAPRSTRRRDLIAAHRDLGLMFALPLAVAALTGAALVFSDPAKAVLGAHDPPKPPRAGVGSIDWPAALAAAQARFPDARLRVVIWPQKSGQPATIRLRQPGEWHANGRTMVWIDPATGAVLGVVDAMALDRGHRAFNAMWPLHAAKVGDGVAARVVDAITAATGLSLAALGLYGAWSFALRKPRRRAVTRPRSSPRAAHPTAPRS
jgi:uncharacterized iron-regulated membrane protein